jgi:hypothetical protein
MVLCPIALAVGCKKCPAFPVCPVKTVIGEYRPDEHDETRLERPPANGRSSGPTQRWCLP